MATKQQDVQLVISARDEASAALRELTDALKSFTQGNEQAEAAVASTGSVLSRLRDEYRQVKEDITKVFSPSDYAQMVQSQEALAQTFEKAKAAYSESAEAARKYGEQIKQLEATQNKLTGAQKLIQQYAVERERLADLERQQAGFTDTVRNNVKALADLEARIKQQAAAAVSWSNATSVSSRALGSLQAEYNKISKAQDQNVASAQKVKAQYQATQESIGRIAGTLREYGVALGSQDQMERKRQASLLSVNKALAENTQAQAAAKAQTEQALNAAQKASQAYQKQAAAIGQVNAQLSKQPAVHGASPTAGGGRVSASVSRSPITEDDAKTMSLFEDNSRKAMSVVQRLRGEVLSLAAAYVGLYGAISQVGASFRGLFEQQATQSRLSAAFEGDAKKMADELAFVDAMADRLGQNIGALETSYTKFLVSAKQSGASTDSIRTIFEAMAESATVMHSSTEDLDGVMVALTQIMGKGTIQAEELRGQLGDRLPGAVAIMAKAVGVSTAQLMKMMQQGQLTSDYLNDFALKMKDVFGGEALDAATQSTQAQINRLQNAFIKLQRTFAANLAPALEGPIKELQGMLDSTEGEQWAQDLAQAFSKLADVLVWVAKNSDDVVLILKMFVGLKLTQVIYDQITGFQNLAKALSSTSVTATALSGTLGVLLAAFEGFQVGGYLYDNIGAVQKFAAEVIGLFEKAGAEISYLWSTMWLGLQRSGLTFIDKELADFTGWKNKIVGLMADMTDALGFDGLAAKLRASMGEYRSELAGQINALDAQIKAYANKRDSAFNTIDAAVGAGVSYADTAGKGTTPGASRADQAREKAQAVADKERDERLARMQGQARDLTNLRKQVDAQIAGVNKKLNELGGNSLDVQLAAVDAQYADLVANLRKLGDSAGLATVQRLIDLEKRQIVQKYNEQQLQVAGDAFNKTLLERQTLLDNINEKQKLGLITWAEAAKEILAVDAKTMPTLERQAAVATKLAQAAGKNSEALATYGKLLKAQNENPAFDVAEGMKKVREDTAQIDGKSSFATLDQQLEPIKKSYEELTAKAQALHDTQALADIEHLENLKLAISAESNLNKSLQDRQALIDSINTQLQLGTITQREAWDKLAEVDDKMLPGIRAQMADLIDLAQKNGNWPMVERVKAAQAAVHETRNEVITLQQANEDLAKGFTDTFMAAVKGLGGFLTGARSLSGVFTDAASAFTNFAQDFLMKIAEMIIQQQILNELQRAGIIKKGVDAANGAATYDIGSTVASWGAAIAKVFHDGGIAGGSSPTMAVNPGIFASAVRYHTGGIAGLKPDEIGAILQKDEEILPVDDPRHRYNGGLTGQVNHINIYAQDAQSVIRARGQIAREISGAVRRGGGRNS